MRLASRIVLWVAAASLAGCSDSPRGSLTESALRNAWFPSEYVEMGEVQLKDGRYEEAVMPGSTEQVSVELTPHIAFGDLDGDGAKDAAGVVVSALGGAARYHDLVVWRNEKRKPLYAAHTSLGDRVKIDAVEIENGVVALKMISHGPNDPPSSPSVIQTRRFRLDGKRLARMD